MNGYRFLLIALSLPAASWAAECQFLETVCLEGPETRIIDGEPVYRTCWKQEDRYACEGIELIEEARCQALRDQGCWQTDSKCLQVDPDTGLCVDYLQTYGCPGPGSETLVNCGMETACAGGDCADDSYPPNENFAESAALFEAMGEVATQLEMDATTVFVGDLYRCSIHLLDFQDCCVVEGWGVDLGLADCSFEEELLGQQRQEGQCHFVGDYCAEETIFGICVREKQSHCCFSSKLSRIIAEEGREQLGRGWGTPEQPDCSGFDVETELPLLDFSAMDLSEFYEDVLADTPLVDPDEAQQRLEESLQQGNPEGGGP